MELTIGSDECLFFKTAFCPTDRIRLTIEERKAEDKEQIAYISIDLTDEECEQLIETLAGPLFLLRRDAKEKER